MQLACDGCPENGEWGLFFPGAGMEGATRYGRFRLLSERLRAILNSGESQ